VADTIFKEVKEQECPLCQAVYTERKSLNQHIRMDHWTTCHLCFRTYKSRQYLEVHLGHFHRSETIECDLATCFFRTKWALSASRHFTSQHPPVQEDEPSEVEDAEDKEMLLAKSGSSPGGQGSPVEATEVLMAAMAVPSEAMAVLVEAMAVLVVAMAVLSKTMVAVPSEAMVAVPVEATAGTPDPEPLASTSAPQT
jgi:hypothetical protein